MSAQNEDLKSSVTRSHARSTWVSTTIDNYDGRSLDEIYRDLENEDGFEVDSSSVIESASYGPEKVRASISDEDGGSATFYYTRSENAGEVTEYKLLEGLDEAGVMSAEQVNRELGE